MSSRDGKRPYISDDDNDDDPKLHDFEISYDDYYGTSHPRGPEWRKLEDESVIKSLTDAMSDFSLSNSSGFNDDNVRENSSPQKQGDKQGWKKKFTSFLKSKGKQQERDYANNVPWECTDDDEACPQPTYDENQVKSFQYDGGLEGSSGAYSNYNMAQSEVYITPSQVPLANQGWPSYYYDYSSASGHPSYQNPEHTQEHGNTVAPTRKSKYKGVRSRGEKWVAQIRLPKTRKREWLGTFVTEEEAARAFDMAKIRIKGSQAHPEMLNFRDNSYWG